MPTRKRNFLPESINKPRLIKEIIVVAAIILACLSPWILSQPVHVSDPYKDYKHLYHIVEKYNYDKGPDEGLEDRIDRALNSNSSSSQRYFNLKAKLEYYYRLNEYDMIKSDLKEAYDVAPTNEELDYLDNLASKILPSPLE